MYMERYIITYCLRILCMEDDIAEVITIFTDTSLKLASTRFRNFKSISLIFLRIAVFKSSRVRGFLSYTRDLRYPQRKKITY